VKFRAISANATASRGLEAAASQPRSGHRGDAHRYYRLAGAPGRGLLDRFGELKWIHLPR
jgi:hypothetical protein